jgi:hypothetical protein
MWTRTGDCRSRPHLGALPAREPEFRPYADNRERPFTTNHALRLLTHTGPKDQALVYYVATRDDNDAQEKQVLNMLERIVRIQLTETCARSWASYSPGASSEPSRSGRLRHLLDHRLGRCGQRGGNARRHPRHGGRDDRDHALG